MKFDLDSISPSRRTPGSSQTRTLPRTGGMPAMSIVGGARMEPMICFNSRGPSESPTRAFSGGRDNKSRQFTLSSSPGSTAVISQGTGASLHCPPCGNGNGSCARMPAAARQPTKAVPPQPRCPYQRTCCEPVQIPRSPGRWARRRPGKARLVRGLLAAPAAAPATERNDFDIKVSSSCKGDRRLDKE
jgi:hypothetical protein